uniref:Putative kazal domain protein n=1 Tax=Rhipicephalus microplus TaxID=6941 RepID=A0A6G5A7N4_RHIMP
MSFTVCFIALTLFLISPNWQTSSKLTVQAGKILYGDNKCWKYECVYKSCSAEAPSDCICPTVWESMFGINNCR